MTLGSTSSSRQKFEPARQRTWTSQPSRTSLRTRFEPMNPVAPVTSAVVAVKVRCLRSVDSCEISVEQGTGAERHLVRHARPGEQIRQLAEEPPQLGAVAGRRARRAPAKECELRLDGPEAAL